jgi:hypothetical protein
MQITKIKTQTLPFSHDYILIRADCQRSLPEKKKYKERKMQKSASWLVG